MFLPISGEEVRKRGWDQLDVVFVTGDAYVDHPAFGVPLLGRWLEAHGFRVGIIPQPDWRRRESFMILGRPRLFFAVSAGAMDSMVAHYTPLKKLRRDDAYTPGGRHGARPNRATIVYTSRLKEAYRDVPVVIGGIEASLRRFAHYDYWDDTVRRSILFDAKADLLVYGMGERPLLELAERLRDGEPFAGIRDVRGTAYVGKRGDDSRCCIDILSFEMVAADRKAYADAFRIMGEDADPTTTRCLAQPHGDRSLVCNPPALPLSEREIDAVYALPFSRLPHPAYREPIPAWEQIRASITTHRGCYGGCAFCAIAHHQGKSVQSRSRASVVAEAERLAAMSWFRGSISDLGGPTANMYGTRCGAHHGGVGCRRGSCLWPEACRHLVVDDRATVALLAAVRQVRGVRHVAVSSGIRHDLLARQPGYFRELVAHHVSGLLKAAPEHSVPRVLSHMRKPGFDVFESFLTSFRAESGRAGKRQAVVPYLISAHPGCTLDDMVELALSLKRLGLKVEQVQDFTPTPGTLATCMYYTGLDPFSGRAVYVERGEREKRLQKALLLSHLSEERGRVIEALRRCGREATADELLGRGGRARPAPERRPRRP